MASYSIPPNDNNRNSSSLGSCSKSSHQPAGKKKRRHSQMEGAFNTGGTIRSLRTQQHSDDTDENSNNSSDPVIDDVTAMNEIGIANLYAGDAMVAKESFISALSRCANDLSSNRLLVAATQQPQDQQPRSSPISSSEEASDVTTMGSASSGNLSSSALASVFGVQNPNEAGNTVVEMTTPASAAKAVAKVAFDNATTTSGASAETSITAASPSFTGNMYIYQREEYDEGMYMYREALYLDRESSMCKHLRDATLMYNVAQTHLRTRQYEDAKRWFFLALESFRQCLPTDKTSLLNDVKIHHNIAFCYYCAGQNDQAMTHYQTALSRLQELGLGSIDSAACCNSIGILHLCRGSAEDSTKAMECLQLALNIYKQTLGPDSPLVATCLSNIARVFFSRQEYETSLTLFQEALKIRQTQSTQGRSSPVDTAAAMFNIGQTYQKLGKPKPALKHFQAFRKLAEPHLGKGHRDIATCIKAMACIHYERGHLETSCTLLEEAVACSRMAPQETPLELACLLRDMGCLYSMTNHLDKALDSHMESLRIQQELYQGDNHNPNIMVTLLHIAQTKKKQGQYQHALDVYREVYSIQLEVFGPASLEVAATLCSIGLMLYLKKNLKSSLNYYQEALKVRQDYFGTNDNFDIAATFNSIGLIAFQMSKLELAKTSFEECIRIRINLEGTACHRDIVTLYSNLGTVYLANGQDKESIQMFAESIRLERKTLGDTNLGVAVSLQHLAQLHQDRGELELAHEYFIEALNITRKVDETSMANKQQTICTLLNLMGNIHLMRAEVPEMMECFIEASRVAKDGRSLVIAGYTFYGISKMHPPCAAEA